MPDPKTSQTNAADSAPGVDDGRHGAPPPATNAKPGGRRAVMWIVLVSLAVLVVVFLARPASEGKGDGISTQAPPYVDAPVDAAKTPDHPP